MPSKIIETFWFTGVSVVGVVVCEDELTLKRKAFIGTGFGYDEKLDEQHIKDFGVSANIEDLKKIVKMMEG